MPVGAGGKKTENPEHSKLYYEINKMKEDGKIREENQDAEEEEEEKEKEPEYPICPYYKIIEVFEPGSESYYDMQIKEKTRPKNIRVEIKLDLVENMSELKCDYQSRNLVLEYKDVYFL